MNILIRANHMALWFETLHAAEASCAIVLGEEVETYLAFLLMRYTSQSDFVSRRMAMTFLEGMSLPAVRRLQALQGVGDECLLVSGLYPGLAKKRRVTLRYFVDLGRTAYHGISLKENDLYATLEKDFVCLMDILQWIRSQSHPELLPLEAFEIWHQTGSRRALSILQGYMQNPDKS